MKPTEKVAVVGCGNWGKNLVRNFHTLGFLYTICDLEADTLARLKKQYAGIHTTSDYHAILADPAVDAIVISTPSHSHYRLAKAALLADKHVYVEKPIATRYVETQELYELSHRMNKILMVGHLLLYHPAINRLKQLIKEGYLGEIRYIQSDRLNLNPYRGDRSVFWDLAPHDLSMMMFLLNKVPSQLMSVQGSQTSDDGLVDIAHIELAFEGGIHAHIHNSWVHPVKQVKLVVRGSDRTAVIDDTLPEGEKLQIFSNDIPPDKVLPEYLMLEPLKLECQHFINCIRSGRTPKSDGVNGLEVVRVLEQAELKLQESGLVPPHNLTRI